MSKNDERDHIALLKLKTQIILLEEKLKIEEVKYRKNKLLEEIKRLKKEFIKIDIFDKPETKHIEKIEINLQGEVKENVILNLQSSIVEIDHNNYNEIDLTKHYKKIIIKDAEKIEKKTLFAEHIEIVNCRNLKLEFVAETVVLRNTFESTFIVESNQLRIKESENLSISFQFATPTVLEQSKNIVFRKIDDKLDFFRKCGEHIGSDLKKGSNSLSDYIKDFDCPFNSQNFKIV